MMEKTCLAPNGVLRLPSLMVFLTIKLSFDVEIRLFPKYDYAFSGKASNSNERVTKCRKPKYSPRSRIHFHESICHVRMRLAANGIGQPSQSSESDEFVPHSAAFVVLQSS